MVTFRLEITLKTPAMQEYKDVAQALRETAEAIDATRARFGSIKDRDGNDVGKWTARVESVKGG